MKPDYAQNKRARGRHLGKRHEYDTYDDYGVKEVAHSLDGTRWIAVNIAGTGHKPCWVVNCIPIDGMLSISGKRNGSFEKAKEEAQAYADARDGQLINGCINRKERDRSARNKMPQEHPKFTEEWSLLDD